MLSVSQLPAPTQMPIRFKALGGRVQRLSSEVGGGVAVYSERPCQMQRELQDPAFSARFRCQACLLLGHWHDLHPLAQSSVQRVCQYTWKDGGQKIDVELQ